MRHLADLETCIRQIIGTRLTDLNLACEMMMFSFEARQLHAPCFTRIIHDDEIVATTMDYQSWDGEHANNNDALYNITRCKSSLVGGVVESVSISALCDLTIILNNHVRIELYASSGPAHFGEENEQWVFFKADDHAHPFITVSRNSIDIAAEW